MATSYLQVENLTKSYGDRMLFRDVTFGVYEGDKIGIIAKNGTGKSTLLNIIAGKESPDSGNITFRSGLRVGILDQTPLFQKDDTALGYCMRDTEHLHVDEHDVWTYEDRARQMLTQLGITDADSPVSTMSGGQSKRVALAKVILGNPDLIILDEPTNHLDIKVIEWIENYLTRSRMTLLMVTHDRYFLDRVTNKIIEIDRESIYTYDGNYDYYLRRRQERIEAMSAELAKVKNTLRKEQEWMRRQPQARAGKAKYRIDAFYDLKSRSRINLSEDNVELNVKSSYIGSKIFEANGVNKRFGEKIILDDFTYTFARYEKVGLIGPNGVGKSTFIKMLQGIVSPDSGEWNVGDTVRFGYYSQEGISFDDNKRVIDAITEIAEDIVVNGDVRYSPMQFLTHFLFSPADQQKYISTLSGGERARLHLASVLMRSPNFLVLDEPTNDLDIMTLGILEDYLRNFNGCLIVVSHDRFFLDSIVDHLFVFEGDGVIKDFPGGYTDYRTWLSEHTENSAPANKTSEAKDNRPRRERNEARMTFKERREFEQLTVEIEQLNNEKSTLEAIFKSGEAVKDIIEKSTRYEEVKTLLDEKELRWLELSEKE
ncbi:MAG TPA: ABC-F family ATP-binding cassette domain-containing protein [Muribaculum sp.]|jgi:ATP-binding cassette subfamily F protein uup|uniref:ABC-F family ATP-binding cassette domain-containing protein n=1 Tax=Heminiphilus faecis TaxID=2601703 RepID=A0ABV4CXS3_9BACT|nr:ABC-F family ATP-binding cassette domain-containing protein [Heminiphilus faecis]RLT76380.1 ABC transporter ATP-binding protein [bacterium J10(2018)]HRF68777.1 ABC-F family ATP-binding cassette domain-containing protein [Muribaculum sp.]